jgi:nuclear transcription factor Y gamma
MIASETTVVFAKACEIFVLELTLRAWRHAEENKRRTLQRDDIVAAITKTEVFDFLVDIVPREEPKDENLVPPDQVVPAAAHTRMQMQPGLMAPPHGGSFPPH